MPQSEWMGTEGVLDVLRGEAGCEMEFRHFLGGILRSTWWMVYDAERDAFGVSTNWFDYEWWSAEEMLEDLKGHWWHRDA